MNLLVRLKLHHCVALNDPSSVNVCWEVNTRIKTFTPRLLGSAGSVLFFLSFLARALLSSQGKHV